MINDGIDISFQTQFDILIQPNSFTLHNVVMKISIRKYDGSTYTNLNQSIYYINNIQPPYFYAFNISHSFPDSPNMGLFQYPFADPISPDVFISDTFVPLETHFDDGDRVYVAIEFLTDFLDDVFTIYNSDTQTFYRAIQSPSPSGGTITPGTNEIWGFPNFTGDDFSVITCSNNAINTSYGVYKQEDIPNSGFNKISTPFNIQLGDEFRFEDREDRVYSVSSFIPPSLHPSGTLQVNFKNPIPTSSLNLDHFLIRRYVEDGSFIIFDSDKPAGASGTSIIKPQYVTTPLEKEAESFTLLLSEKGLITD
jgi:hypothetical protein